MPHDNKVIGDIKQKYNNKSIRKGAFLIQFFRKRGSKNETVHRNKTN